MDGILDRSCKKPVVSVWYTYGTSCTSSSCVGDVHGCRNSQLCGFLRSCLSVERRSPERAVFRLPGAALNRPRAMRTKTGKRKQPAAPACPPGIPLVLHPGNRVAVRSAERGGLGLRGEARLLLGRPLKTTPNALQSAAPRDSFLCGALICGTSNAHSCGYAQ